MRCGSRIAPDLIAIIKRALGGTEANSVLRHGRNRSRRQLFAVPRQYNAACGYLFSRIKIDQTNDPAVTPPEHDRQLTEILVERNEDPTFALRPLVDSLVAGIGLPITCPNRIVPISGERRASTRRNAGVQQELQVAESVKAGSTRSRPTKRRAYTRQARMSSGSRNG